MNPRLLVDSLRRNWSTLLIKSGIGAVIWITAGADLISTGTAMAASMSLAMFAGFVGSSQLVAPREVLILPIGRTAIWRTRFWFGTFIVPAAIAVGKLMAVPVSTTWSQPAPGLETIAISTALDLVAAPIMAWVVTVAPLTTPLQMAVGLPIILLGPFLPFAIADRLPVALNQFTPVSIGLTALAAVAGVAMYLRTPFLVTTASPAANRAALKSKGRGRWPEFKEVTGLRRLLLRTWATSLAIQICTLSVMVTILPLIDWLVGDPVAEGWLSYARDFGLLPFESGSKAPNVVMAWMFASVGSEVASRIVRHLRTLPISTRGLTGILMSVSFMTWTNAWFVLAAFHIVATGDPLQTSRLPMLVGVIGADCLFRALQLRWRRPAWVLLAFILVALPVAFIATRLPLQAEVLFAGIGLSALCTATALNLHTLRNNRAVYARLPRRTGFGMEVPS